MNFDSFPIGLAVGWASCIVWLALREYIIRRWGP